MGYLGKCETFFTPRPDLPAARSKRQLNVELPEGWEVESAVNALVEGGYCSGADLTDGRVSIGDVMFFLQCARLKHWVAIKTADVEDRHIEAQKRSGHGGR